MKITCCLKIRSLILAIGLGAGIGLVSPAFAQVHSYLVDLNSKKVTELRSPVGGNTYARAINAVGQVVGRSAIDGSEDVFHAFITGPNGAGMTNLDTPGGDLTMPVSLLVSTMPGRWWGISRRPDSTPMFLLPAPMAWA